jgi:hypothetical protein
MSQPKVRVISLTGIEFLTLSMCTAEVAALHEQRGDLPTATLRTLDILSRKCADLANVVRNGAIDFGLQEVSVRGEGAATDVMGERPSGTVLS